MDGIGKEIYNELLSRMGPKKKNLSSNIQHSPGANVISSARNLPKNDLGAVIFGCTHKTMKECRQQQIFGLPAIHMSYVKNIQPGLPLFLFNYSNRLMYGIYVAASHGQMNINPYGWTDGSQRTSYPAQVRICVRKQCQPLPEEKYKPIIADNYYGQSHHFWFELDKSQTGALLSLFESLSVTTDLPDNAPIQRILREVFNIKGRVDKHGTPKSASKQACSNVASKGVPVLKENPDIDARTGDKRLESSVLEVGCTQLEDGDLNVGSSSKVFCWEDKNEEIQILDTHSNKEGTKSEEERICLKLKQLTLDRENLNTYPKEHREEAVVPCTMSETHLENKISSKREVVSTNSSDFQSIVHQLRRELEDLMVEFVNQSEKKSALENKLACAESALHRLRDHVKSLESQLKGSSTTYVGEPSESYCSDTPMQPFSAPQLGIMELIFVMGGSVGDGSCLSTVESYSISQDIVQCLKPMSSTRSCSSAAVTSGYIFNIGGQSGSSWSDTVECYNPWNDEWTSFSPLSEKKGYLASATLHSKIYVFGGGNEDGCTSKVEMFNPVFGKWIRTQSMREKRGAAGAAELNGVLYVVGGFDEHYLKSAERFDPREGSWSRIPNMNISRGSHSLAVLNDKMYAMGGYDGPRMLASVEVFDPRIGLWVVDAEMNESRGHFFAPVIDDTIYAIGGLTEMGGQFADTVECYQEGRGWSITGLKGIKKKHSFAATLF